MCARAASDLVLSLVAIIFVAGLILVLRSSSPTTAVFAGTRIGNTS